MGVAPILGDDEGRPYEDGDLMSYHAASGFFRRDKTIAARLDSLERRLAVLTAPAALAVRWESIGIPLIGSETRVVVTRVPAGVTEVRGSWKATGINEPITAPVDPKTATASFSHRWFWATTPQEVELHLVAGSQTLTCKVKQMAGTQGECVA